VNLGALPLPEGRGVRFRVWAPCAESVALHLRRDGRPAASYQLSAASCQREAESAPPPDPWKLDAGCWELIVADAAAGDRYAYSIDGRDALPDPASRYQPDGVHAWSEVVDPRAFAWTDSAWRGLDPRRAAIYELHVGTFTREGTFASAATKLPPLRDLGVTAIELMPLADFPGLRNWGYDGVALFAPSRAYGRPHDLRAFVDAAHGLGLAVLIDVVYNHLGPEGAYLPTFAPPFLTPKHQTPWGDAVNLDEEGSDGVRALLLDNALHWIREYHADGLRIDAVHALIDHSKRPFVAELAAAVHAAAYAAEHAEAVDRAGQPRLVYAEDCRNLAMLVQSTSHGGCGLDGVWADDFHHIVRRMLAGDDHGYYVDYQGTVAELTDTLRNGWLYRGQPSRYSGAPRGTSASAVEMRKAIVCVQNHDQVGNRAFGDRLHQGIDPASWRAAVTLLLTSPMTPLLFMGQEWAASTPFQFFTDFEPDLGRRVISGRRAEFRAFPEFATPEAASRIPDPQAEMTFARSRLNWDERAEPEHAIVLALHRALLRLRAANPALQASDACSSEARESDQGSLTFVRAGVDGRFLIVVRLRGSGAVDARELTDRDFQLVLDTEDHRFALDPAPPTIDCAAGMVDFRRPGAIILHSSAT
jgi:maltooligosyltrehalose trehalohydrolase